MTPRSSVSWLAIACRLLAIVAVGFALVREGGIRWVLVAVALGLVLVPFTWRRKAAPATGAIWNASADLIEGGKHAPGELSFTPDAVVWTPNSHSLSNGHEGLVLSLTEGATVELTSGPALLDVFVDVREPGREVRFLTHRSKGLERAVSQLST
jgi:hypothetical protein